MKYKSVLQQDCNANSFGIGVLVGVGVGVVVGVTVDVIVGVGEGQMNPKVQTSQFSLPKLI